MKNRKLLSVLLTIIWVAQLLVEVLTFGVIFKLDMLPALYLVVLAVLLVLLWALPGVLLFRKKGNNGRRIVALILIIVIVLGCAGVSGAVSRLDRTVNSVTGNKEITTIMTVYVRMSDPAQSISDAEDYTFAVMKDAGVERTRKALRNLEEELNKTLVTAEYATIIEMADALYAGEVDAVLTSSAYMGMLEDIDGYKDYEMKMRPLYEVSFVEYVADIGGSGAANTPNVTRPVVGGDKENTDKENDVAVENTIVNTPFIMYLSGNDTRNAELVTSRSDTNILAVVNPVTKQILLVNTPRDYYIPHPLSPEGLRDKLTHLGNDGVECSIAGLEALYNERVDFYAQINFTGFETLIDAIGGVTVHFDYSFVARGQTPIYEGENHLSGKEALQVARDRGSFADGDNARGRHQMKIIKAVVQKMMSGTILTRYEQILDSLEGMFVTDLSKEDVSKLVKMQLSDLASWNIQTYAVIGTSGEEPTYTAGYAYVMYPIQESVDFAKDLIDRVIAGDVLTDEDVIFPG